MELRLTVQRTGGCEEMTFACSRLLNGGWAARDGEGQRRHVEELSALGIAPPESVPDVFFLTDDRVSTAATVQVTSGETSGEGEYVLLFAADEVFVGIGSDHTDREIEKVSIPGSKQMCPDLMGATVWPYEEVRGHWDELRIRCVVRIGTGTALYHDSSTKELLHPEEWKRHLRGNGLLQPGLVFFSGAVPAVDGVRSADEYTMQLLDPVVGRTLEHSYRVERVDQSFRPA